jgi:hypothetical protein
MKNNKPEKGALQDQIFIALPSELKHLATSIQTLVDSAKGLLRCGSGGRAVDYVAIEQEIEEKTAAVERSSHVAILESLEVDSPRVTIQGETYRRVGHGLGTYYTKAGAIQVKRALYRRSGQRIGKTVDAISHRTGAVADGWLPRTAEAMAFMLQQGTSREAESAARMSGRLCYSRTSFERIPHDFAARYLQHQADIEDSTIQSFEIPEHAHSISVSIDRVSLPMEEPGKKPKGRPKKGAPKKPILRNYRMAYCGCLTIHDAEGNAIQTFRYGTMPAKDADQLCYRMSNDAGWLMEKRPDLQLILLADGAHEMWNLLELHFPEETFGKRHRLVDFWHAAEKLSPAAKAIHGSTGGKMALERWCNLLRRNSKAAETILKELEESGCEYSKTLDKYPVHEAMTYLANHSREDDRMNYAAARRKKLPIGSGNVEATCKCLVETRMKRAGSRWKTETGEHLLQLRSLALSDRWGPAMELLHARYRTSVRPAA